jgi:hypothetical protein
LVTTSAFCSSSDPRLVNTGEGELNHSLTLVTVEMSNFPVSQIKPVFPKIRILQTVLCTLIPFTQYQLQTGLLGTPCRTATHKIPDKCLKSCFGLIQIETYKTYLVLSWPSICLILCLLQQLWHELHTCVFMNSASNSVYDMNDLHIHLGCHQTISKNFRFWVKVCIPSVTVIILNYINDQIQ